LVCWLVVPVQEIFYPALAAPPVRPPHRTLFQFMCPHRSVPGQAIVQAACL
jgi:hypothetical protein